MTYDASEKSRYGGQPIEGIRFSQGSKVWLYTAADREITLPAGVFTPESITRSEIEFSKEDSGETVEFTVPRTNPVVAGFIGELPSSPMLVAVYRAHRGEEGLAIAKFSGEVLRARFEESQAVLVASSVMALLDRSVPPLAMQTPCNQVLYSDGCGADPTASRDLISVTTVNGVTVVSNDFALRADGWFKGGRLVNMDASETRFIADHVGDTVTLLSPMPRLASLDQVWAQWGCDHLETTCIAKFNNLNNHLGWSRLPTRNPFTGRVD